MKGLGGEGGATAAGGLAAGAVALGHVLGSAQYTLTPADVAVSGPSPRELNLHRGQSDMQPMLQHCAPRPTRAPRLAPPSCPFPAAPVARLVKGATGEGSQATCKPVTTSPGLHRWAPCSWARACVGGWWLPVSGGRRHFTKTRVHGQPAAHHSCARAAHSHQVVQELSELDGRVGDAAREGAVGVRRSIAREHLQAGARGQRSAVSAGCRGVVMLVMQPQSRPALAAPSRVKQPLQQGPHLQPCRDPRGSGTRCCDAAQRPRIRWGCVQPGLHPE